MFNPKISKEEVNQLPIAEFTGKIVLVDTRKVIDKALDELFEHPIVGIDTETRPSFTRGIAYKVSLLQLATSDTAYLFRLNKVGFPKRLIEFLSDEKILKIGLALRDDFNGLAKQRKFKAAGFIDIQNIAKDYGILELGLQKIFAILFGQKISKSQRLTNWENDVLTEAQKLYAATDAWATLQIYLRLSQEKKLSKKELDAIIAQVNEENN
ncbi:MAG TPA: 3'-5' exonuclease domain-containing protein 2 [Bacteroidales bacterium]|nr:3'-5' exonuclease domain-containing protein 2 [Bacteroidales bacterium]